MPRRNSNAKDRGNHHSRNGGGWMGVNKGKGGKKRHRKAKGDRAPLTPGAMHSRTRLR
jgi:hypothetical protein